MNDLQIFSNPSFGKVRTISLEGEPWFVGKDVAVALGYRSPRSAVSKIVDDEDRGVSKMETPSGKQNTTIINESGLYSLIFSSKLPSARQFKRWVTSEILPAIRKTGSYRNNKQDYLEAARLIASCQTIQEKNHMIKVLQAGGFDIPQLELIPSEKQKLNHAEFGKQFKQFLLDHGWTYRSFCKASGLSKSTICVYAMVVTYQDKRT